MCTLRFDDVMTQNNIELLEGQDLRALVYI